MHLLMHQLFKIAGTFGPHSWLPPLLAPLSLGALMSSVEAATCSQEQLSQVRHLASIYSRAAQGAQIAKIAH